MSRWPLFLVALVGCGSSSSDSSPAADSSTTASPSSPAPSTAAPRSTIKPPGHAYTDDDVPVPGDFAEAAEKDITEANYKEQLATLRGKLGDAMKAQGMKPTASAPHGHEHEHEGTKHQHPHDHTHGGDHAHGH